MSCVYFECVYLISKSCHIGQKKGEEMWKGVGGVGGEKQIYQWHISGYYSKNLN